ncbi:MAG: hypothetical protein Sapg2KO_16310 [Saprospiraceae bacterium]
MDPVFKKMNYKTQETILVLNAPNSFQPCLDTMADLCKVEHDLTTQEVLDYVLIFLTEAKEIQDQLPPLVKKLRGDALLWIAYPKKSSKNYQSDITRDNGWEIMGALKMEPVRQIAIDADWSALRFRKVDFIKKITRRASMALSQEAKNRTTNPK